MSDLLIMEIGCRRKLVSCGNSVILKGMASCDNVVPRHGPLDVMTGQFDWLYAADPASFPAAPAALAGLLPPPSYSCVPWTLISPLSRWLLS